MQLCRYFQLAALTTVMGSWTQSSIIRPSETKSNNSPPCPGSSGTDCWSYLSQTYLALFDKQHLLNLTKWLSAENFPLDATARSAASCTQPALGWQSLSLPSWQGALATTPGGVHRRFMDASLLESVHDKIRFSPPSGTPITFQTECAPPICDQSIDS